MTKKHTSLEREMIAALQAFISALDVPRNRFGKLDGDIASSAALADLAQKYRLPGARDTAEQVVLVARALIKKAEQ